MDKGTFVLDVEFTEADEKGTITLDSGAGVNVWPNHMLKGLSMLPKREGLKMVAANGTAIDNLGQKIIKFRGVEHTGDKMIFKRRV